MPSVIQCQNCFLAFNLGVSGGGKYKHFANCSACGTIHIVRYHLGDGHTIIDDVAFDTLGPRTVVTPTSNSDTFDLTLHSHIAEDSAFARCNADIIGKRFEKIDAIFSALRCGGCSERDLRTASQDNAVCPRCHFDSLCNVGGWL